MLVRHGHVVAEGWWSPYNAQSRHSMYSLSKSFTSTAVGLAVAEGKLSVSDEVLKFFPDAAPDKPSANLKAMRVADLLRMNTGQHADDVAKFSFDSTEPLVNSFLAIPVAHKPGTHFVYNTPATFMASAIVQTATGEAVFDYLKPRLFEPLGIANPTWEMRQQYTFGGSGLAIRTEDIARFGQLYLQKGRWQDRQLVPAEWIESATSRQTSNGSNPESDWDQGYGYQFWRCRHGLYRGDGAFGQYCIIMQQQDAVVAITSGTRDMQGIMDLVWDKLLPAMQPKRLKADKAAQATLADRLAALTVQPQQGSGKAGDAALGKRFVFPPNDQNIQEVALESDGGRVMLVMKCNGVQQRISCGEGDWQRGRLTYAELADQPVAVSGAWTGDGVYTVKFCFYETPFIVTAGLTFAGNELRYNAEYNVSFDQRQKPQLTGVQP